MNRTTESLAMPVSESTDVLTDVLRGGAQQLLAQAVEAEVADWIESHKHHVDENGYRTVVRNGHLPSRKIVTGIGAVEVTQPRVCMFLEVGERTIGGYSCDHIDDQIAYCCCSCSIGASRRCTGTME